jgi:hypothetical protein
MLLHAVTVMQKTIFVSLGKPFPGRASSAGSELKVVDGKKEDEPPHDTIKDEVDN